MKIAVVRDWIRRSKGYRVHFERRHAGMLESDRFPDGDEPAIDDLEDAWRLACDFAALDPAVFVNVYVTYAYDHTPVENYQQRRFNTHPPQREATPAIEGGGDA